MTGLLASLITLQMTFGPHCLAYEQKLISVETEVFITRTVYRPALMLALGARPVARLFNEMDDQYRRHLPSKHPFVISGMVFYRRKANAAR